MRNESTYYRTEQVPEPARLAGLATLALLTLAGCTVGPKYHQPPALTQAPPPPTYKEAKPPAPTAEDKATGAAAPSNDGLSEWKPANPSDAMLRGKWWEIYNEPELNALEDQLNINNQTIKQYFENFMEARAIVREARAQYYPTVTASPSWGRSRGSANLGNNTGTNKAGSTASLITYPSTSPGNPTSLAVSGIRFMRPNITRRSAPPTSKTSASPNRPVWPSTILISADKTSYRRS